MEVIDAELIQASPPPLPRPEEPVEEVDSPPPSRIAGIVLPVVRAGLRMVQKCEDKLEVLEAKLAVAADHHDAENTNATPDDGGNG